ncbi:uncharacterized protein LOC134853264 [Symsagittifera roscoffensis]|uniref:uncharacterized protein LOC134853264 n=1 Tax=Symsagittifera roscoffensis TaxID=84072 RepID=UPI00307BE757
MHLALYFLLSFVFSTATDASTQLDLSLFREECPCLKAYDAEPVFAYYAYDIDSCVVYCIGVQACEAVNYCSETKLCKGYSKFGVGYEPEAINNLDCTNFPSYSSTSSERWYWVKEVIDGETTDCQIEHNRLGQTPTSNDYTIQVRGYPLRVFCDWGQNGAPTKTYMNLASAYTTYSHWGGSIYSTDQPIASSTRTFQKVRLLVDKCFLAVSVDDVSYSTLSGAFVENDFTYLFFGKGGNCKSYQTSSPGKHDIYLLDTPFMFAAGLTFRGGGWQGHIQGDPILEPQRSYIMAGGGCGIIQPFSVKDPKTNQDLRLTYIPLNMYDRTGMATT